MNTVSELTVLQEVYLRRYSMSTSTVYLENLSNIINKKMYKIERDQEKMTSASQEVVHKLRAVSALNVVVDRLIFSKQTMHTFLLMHEFQLLGTLPFNPLDTELEYDYKFRYRPEFIFKIIYRKGTIYISVTVERLLNGIPRQYASFSITELPTLADDSGEQDGYLSYKVMIRATIKLSKLWTKFQDSSASSIASE